VGEPLGMPRRYSSSDEPVPGNPPQKVGRPRAGFGTVYLNDRRDGLGHRVWTATWIDKSPEPDLDGATFGVAEFEGDRTAAVAWVRSCPAATRVTYSRQTGQEVPLPDDDRDIDI
jgi:hypothetical protein